MPTCPFCSSDEVYRLLNTLRCKRCKNIWKEDEEDPCRATACNPVDTMTRKKTEPLKTRLEMRLDECLTRSKGRFCLTTMTWQAGDISWELFRRYVRQCVKDRTLVEKKDRYGRTWYQRPRPVKKR